MPCFLELLYKIFYSSVVVMLILPVLIILRYTLRYYTILILAGARHVTVIVIGELFFKFLHYPAEKYRNAKVHFFRHLHLSSCTYRFCAPCSTQTYISNTSNRCSSPGYWQWLYWIFHANIKLNNILVPYSHTHTSISNTRFAMRCSNMEDTTYQKTILN